MKAFCDTMKEKNIPVVILNGDLSIDRVFARVLKSLKPFIEERNSIFERLQIQDLRPRDVERYERSYHYKKSQYGLNSPFNIAHPQKSKEHALVY